MLQFLDLNIRNFLSYGNTNTVIKLNKNGVVLIAGVNGVGKSAIIQALLYVLYDKTLSNCKVDELINNVNKKHMEVSVTFYIPNIGYYKILRARKMKPGGSGNYVKLYFNKDETIFNETHNETLDGNYNTDKKILSVINIPFEMFVRIVVISATNTSFLDLPANHAVSPSQTSFIERLFNMTILADKASVIKDLVKSTEDSLKIQLIQIQSIEREQLRLVEQIQNIKQKADTFDDNNQIKITELESKLAKINNLNLDNERELYNKSNELEVIKKKLIKQQATLSSSVQKYEKLQIEKTHEINHLNSNTCPYCLQTYTNKEKITECEIQIKDCIYNIAELLEFIDAIAIDIETNIVEHNNIINQITVHNLEELIDIKNESQYTTQRVEELKIAPNVYYEQYIELKKTCIEDIDYTEVNRLRRLSEHQQFLLKLLVKKDSFIRKKLLTVNLQYLNARLQHYLVDLELPFKVEFTHQMIVEITHLGRYISSNNLSNGQRSRVNIAMTMAFRDVRQKLHIPVNICLFDEALDIGLDGAGMTAAISMLKRKARDENTTLYIITHREETMTLFDQVMDVSMADGYSVIMEK